MNYIRTKLDQLKLISAPVILLLIAIWACLSAILAWVMWSVGFAVWTSAKMSMLVSLLAWSYVVLKTPVFDWFFINVEANWVVILANHLKRDKQVSAPTSLAPGEKDPRTQMRTLKSLREVPGPGFYGKLPWERQFDSVDLRKNVVIGSTEDKPLTCYTEENVEIQVVWQAIITPLPGFCANLVRRGADAIEAFIKGEFDQAIINWVKSTSETAVFNKLSDLRDVFENEFDGPDRISKREEDNGVFTNTPQITSVRRSAAFQKAAEAKQVGDKVAEVIKALKLSLGDDADPNMILAAASAITGNDINGLVLIPGIGNNPQAIAAATAIADAFGNKKTKTGKKGSAT